MGYLTNLHTRLVEACGQSFFAEADIWGDLSVNTVLLRFTAVSVLALTLLKIAAFFRRTPSIDREFATKAEVAEAIRALTTAGDARRNEIEGRIEALRKQVERKMDTLQQKLDVSSEREGIQMQGIHRQLGEIAGQLKSLQSR